jgi:hypothetical protein
MTGGRESGASAAACCAWAAPIANIIDAADTPMSQRARSEGREAEARNIGH